VVPFLEERPLEPGEQERFGVPAVSAQAASLYDHCLRALERGQTRGPHGLPLIGNGDWNDGMNRVGHLGRGESVWVGWFLAATLNEFAPLCQARGDAERAAALRAEATRLAAAIDEQAWDGEWYRRAYFDDGTPLGSATNDACAIDAIAQSWSVISGVGRSDRARQAMESLHERLIRSDLGMILLLAPPFQETGLDPGYIKGYLPGVRENGGQYTHGALWAVQATALLGDGDRAGELFGWLNPINRGLGPEAVERYKVEPYVVAADIYASAQHLGRGGWTWYTGSAGWMYRLAIETLLGFRLRGDHFALDPVIPRAWPGFKLRYRAGSTQYEITVENPDGVSQGVRSSELDGRPLAGNTVPLVDDGQEHRLRVVLGRSTSSG
jgi:cyclic beta-1,2-glucan synthetase